MLSRRLFLASAVAVPVACRAQNRPVVSPEDMGWTPETSPVDTAAMINAALEKAAKDGIAYYDNARRTVGGTIRIKDRVVIEAGTNQNWIADYAPERFDAVQLYRDGAYRDSGRRVFVNTAGARGSIVRGPLTLTGSFPRNMSLAERAKIPVDLVAITAAEPKAATEISFDSLEISGFGYALYQGTQYGAPQLILPYTRWSVDIALIRFCLRPIVTGARGVGMDDAMFDVLRLSRNAGVSVLRGTDLNASSIFCYGLNPREDIEPGTIALRAGDASAVLPGMREGTTIAALGGGMIGDNPTPFVSEIVAVSGDTVTFAEAPDVDFTGRYAVDPPSLLLSKTGLNAVHLYLEGLHGEAIKLEQGGKVSVLDLKISGGNFAARGGYPIHGEGDVAVNESPRTKGNRWIRALRK